ncbi:hypothetical protein M422DRAFT_183219 [Sphaerobolus stellatus SS14]|uniref:Uncharacterized protein n=1 Tax=Sphaerobolus stellatus (strain SS14) TaxID=990650 RepID=A0A0C9TT76_SPHS4|nr:hypothetical protein M422DRAFT_183219 [Sphaerobolus stellatus SS14]
MFFTRVFAFAVFAVSLVSAVAIKKRADVSEVLGVVDILKSSTDAILPQIDSLVNSNAATQANISPHLASLVEALNTASTSLHGLQGNVDTSSSDANEVANAVAPVFTKINNSINNLETKDPNLVSLVATSGISTALDTVLTGWEIVVAGVLQLLSGL